MFVSYQAGIQGHQGRGACQSVRVCAVFISQITANHIGFPILHKRLQFPIGIRIHIFKGKPGPLGNQCKAVRNNSGSRPLLYIKHRINLPGHCYPDGSAPADKGLLLRAEVNGIDILCRKIGFVKLHGKVRIGRINSVHGLG